MAEAERWQAQLAKRVSKQALVSFDDWEVLQELGFREVQAKNATVFMTPEGERKRPLPLALGEGQDTFLTKDELMDYVRRTVAGETGGRTLHLAGSPCM